MITPKDFCAQVIDRANRDRHADVMPLRSMPPEDQATFERVIYSTLDEVIAQRWHQYRVDVQRSDGTTRSSRILAASAADAIGIASVQDGELLLACVQCQPIDDPPMEPDQDPSPRPQLSEAGRAAYEAYRLRLGVRSKPYDQLSNAQRHALSCAANAAVMHWVDHTFHAAARDPGRLQKAEETFECAWGVTQGNLVVSLRCAIGQFVGSLANSPRYRRAFQRVRK